MFNKKKFVNCINLTIISNNINDIQIKIAIITKRTISNVNCMLCLSSKLIEENVRNTNRQYKVQKRYMCLMLQTSQK